jgi:exopolyphosphatase / guanosine-5'-triphosphate,3'-diphosphate pyrophosphatase
MNKRVAVMDLGTNTFHLLIAEGDDVTGLREIVHEQEPVKLGEGGINKGLIQPAAFERGINTMLKYHQLIVQNNVTQVKAIATSALRNAANGQEFIDKVKEQTGIAIELINGDEEAAYIYKGVKACGCLSDANSLIVDIGGGSVEFIICDAESIKWKQSFEIGAARLMDKFHQTDPIPKESITELIQYLENCVKDLFVEAGHYNIDNIIGSSGVFETYAALIEKDKENPFDLKTVKYYEFEKATLLKTIEKLISSSHRERAAMQSIIPIRIDMIVTASILTRFVVERLEINKVAMSSYSLKEGVITAMFG